MDQSRERGSILGVEKMKNERESTEPQVLRRTFLSSVCAGLGWVILRNSSDRLAPIATAVPSEGPAPADTYNPDGHSRITTYTSDLAGQRTTYTFDKFGKVTQIAYEDGTTKVFPQQDSETS